MWPASLQSYFHNPCNYSCKNDGFKLASSQSNVKFRLSVPYRLANNLAPLFGCHRLAGHLLAVEGIEITQN